MGKEKMTKKEAIEKIIKDNNELLDCADFVVRTNGKIPHKLPLAVEAMTDNEKRTKYLQNTSKILAAFGLLKVASTLMSVGTTVATFAAPITMGMSTALIPSAIVSGIVISTLLLPKEDSKIMSEQTDKIKQKKAELKKIYDKNKVEIRTLLDEQSKIIKQKSEVLFEKSKDLGIKISILADDAVHVDVNKRIQKYDEIILKQYNLQKDLAESYNKLVENHNKLQTKYDELVKANEQLELIVAALTENEQFTEAINRKGAKK